jgi:FOG: Ankyrin repeat
MSCRYFGSRREGAMDWDNYSSYDIPERITVRVRETLGLLEADPDETRPETASAVTALLADETCYVRFLQLMESASSPGYLHLYDRFLAAGFSVDQECFFGFPVLHGAIYALNLPLAARMVKAGAFLGQYRGCTHNGWKSEPYWTTPLHRAVQSVRARYTRQDWGWREPLFDPPLTPDEEHVCLRIITLLLDAGADPNQTDDDGATPLLELLDRPGKDWTREHGDFLYRAARLLVDRGADRACMHRHGKYPLTCVYLEENPRLFALLHGNDPATRAKTLPKDFLTRCDSFPGPGFLKQLLDLGVAVNGRNDWTGHTPLTRLLGDLHTRTLYLQDSAWSYRRAHPGVKLTPQERLEGGLPDWNMRLARDCEEEVETLLRSLLLLLEAGATLNVADADGYTVAEAALRVNDVRAMAILREFGLRVPDAVYNGAPSLVFHVSSTRGGTACLDLLLSMGCGIRKGDANTFTPLHVAAQYGDPFSIRRLVERGADVHALTVRGRATLLHMLMLSFNDPPLPAAMALEALLDCGADPNARDRRGFTPPCTTSRSAGRNVSRATTARPRKQKRTSPIRTSLPYGAKPWRRRSGC